MIDNGWIKIHRKFVGWEWYDDINTKVVFLHLLLTVNWEKKKWHGVEVNRGQLITSIESLRDGLRGKKKKCPLTAHQVRTALEHLKMTNEIAIETTPNYTVISINKYNEYQETASEIANDKQTISKRIATTKEYKNIRSKEDIYIPKERIGEIAEKYNISEVTANSYYEDLVLYCKRNGKQYKDYESALMTWIRTGLKKGDVKRMIITRTPEVEQISDGQRELNIKRLEEIRSQLGNRLHLNRI